MAGSSRGGCVGSGRARPHRSVLARGELPDRRPDLPARQPAAARAAAAGAHQAAPARPLGNVAGPQPRVRAPEPAHPRNATLNVIYIAGPGHGGPAILANVYLEGTYSEVYPEVTRDEAGMRRLFRQFSTPGGVPSHVSVPTPGSIHEGGELGYVLVHAFGAAFDNPDLVVACVVGDGEAETGPLEGSWKGVHFLNPAARRRGAADPAPERLQDRRTDGARPHGRRRHPAACFDGHGYDVHFVEGDEPARRPRSFAADARSLPTHGSARSRRDARARRRHAARPRWPAIVLRTPKGWTGPRGRRRPCRSRARSARTRSRWRTCATNPRAPRDARGVDAQLSSPRSCSTTTDACVADLAQLAPAGDASHGRESARQRRAVLSAARPPGVPRLRGRRAARPAPSGTSRRARSARCCATCSRATRRQRTSGSSAPTRPNSNRLGAVFEVENRCTQRPGARRPTITSRPTVG